VIANIRHCLLLTAACTLALPLLAPQSAAAADIAVVDVQRILEESTAGRIARDLLQQSTRRTRAKLDRLKGELDELQQRWESQKAVLKPKAQEELQQQIIEKQTQLREQLQKAQSSLQERDAELTGSILEELQPIIADLAEKRGFKIVLERGEAGILHMQEKLDITDVVLNRYDASKEKKKKKDD